MTGQPTAVVGNPKPGSRTLHAPQLLAEQLAGGEPAAVEVVDVITLGADLLGSGGAGVAAAVATVGGGRGPLTI